MTSDEPKPVDPLADHADRLERALADLDARKRDAAALAAEQAPQMERLRALQAKLEALPQPDRREVLDAVGLHHVSCAPVPLKPITGGSVRTAPAPTPRIAHLIARFAGPQSPANMPQPPSAAPPVPSEARGALKAEAPQKRSTKHRAGPLDAVLSEAKRQAVDPTDWLSVWAALVALAEPATRPSPLMGYVEGEGVQYRTDNAGSPVGYLTRDALRLRFKRMG